MKPVVLGQKNSTAKVKKNKEKAAIVMLLQQYREYKEYKDVLFNDKCIKHSKNTIQSYENRIVTYEISKI